MIRWAVRSVEIYMMMASAAAFVASERTLFAGSQPSPLFAASPRCAGGKAPKGRPSWRYRRPEYRSQGKAAPLVANSKQSAPPRAAMNARRLMAIPPKRTR